MSFWQEKNRGKMLVKSNQAEKIIKIGDFQIEKRSIGFGQCGLFLLGLEVGKIENVKNIIFLEKDLINLCKKEKSLFIQIETFNLNSLREELQELKFKKFKKSHYKKFITPYTAIIDLEKSEEEILAQMKPKGRYNIRLAEKKAIKVVIVDKTDDNVKVFYNLMLETTSRDKFSGNTFSYYKNFLEIIDNSKLLIAYYENIAIASGIFIFDKEVSIYYYGASTNDLKYRNMMAPYLLQWTAIKEAKKSGSKYYDFLGISSPGEKNSSLAGVTDFKLKLTKDLVKVSDSYIWVRNKFLYGILNFLRYLKAKINN